MLMNQWKMLALDNTQLEWKTGSVRDKMPPAVDKVVKQRNVLGILKYCHLGKLEMQMETENIQLTKHTCSQNE